MSFESSTGSVTSASGPTSNNNTGDVITATTFNSMVNLISNLLSHNHTFNDTYNTNCQCDCGRGSC